MTDGSFLTDVSRETIEKLSELEALVRKWNRSINLVANSTLGDFFNRHISDAAQIASIAPQEGDWIDLGSGGGFPGVVVAILDGHRRSVTLVESDGRKCAFLSTVRRDLGLNCTVLNSRIEDVAPSLYDVISARALAPLPKLIELSQRFGGPTSSFIFPKGRNWEAENIAAKTSWQYDLEVVPSASSTGSVILKIRNIERVEA